MFYKDIGPPKYVGRIPFLKRTTENQLLNLRPRKNLFRFGDILTKFVGYVQWYLTISSGISLTAILSDIFKVDVRPLLAVHILDKHQLIADTVLDHLVRRTITPGTSSEAF